MTSTTAPILQWANAKGAFVRQASKFRNFIEKGGQFEPEANRYHLYISYACPWVYLITIFLGFIFVGPSYFTSSQYERP